MSSTSDIVVPSGTQLPKSSQRQKSSILYETHTCHTLMEKPIASSRRRFPQTCFLMLVIHMIIQRESEKKTT